MKTSYFVAATILAAGLSAIASQANAQTLEKVADRNKITVSYRDASVPRALFPQNRRFGGWRNP